jgi:ComF family protein
VTFVDLLAPPVCAACDQPLRRDAVFCRPCLDTLEPPPSLPTGITAAYAYGGALSEAIRRLKFKGRVDLIRPLRRLVVERLPPRAEVELVAPVPSHLARLRSRGFDAPSLLASAVARALGRPVEHELLKRIVDTPHLSALDIDHREATVKNAFRARYVSASRVLLVDDVRTTGATLRAACRALEERGVLVLAHVLAATPLTNLS